MGATMSKLNSLELSEKLSDYLVSNNPKNGS
jgi:hypothetical protein